MRPETVFDVASLAKQFTAAAVVLLEARGKLRVSEPVARYVPGVPADKRAITLHALLTHTSGLSENHCEDDLADMTREEALEAIFAAPLVRAPTRFSYSNSGFTLLAAVVEETAGMAFEEFLRTQLFEPADLRSTGFPGDAKWARRRVARGYMNGKDHGSPAFWPVSSWSAIGAARVLSTVDDLHTWVTNLAAGAVVPPAAVELLFRRWVREAGSDGHYGYGWSLADTELGPVVEHDGGGPGGNTDVAWYPDASLFVAIAGNRITWQGALGLPLVIRLPATEAREALQRSLATGDFSRGPRTTFSLVPYASGATARLAGFAKAARAVVRGTDDAPLSTRQRPPPSTRQPPRAVQPAPAPVAEGSPRRSEPPDDPTTRR